jgi:hypothetical protein
MIRMRQAASLAHRAVVGVAFGALLQGCVAGLPQRRPGSNITLPKPETSALVDLLMGGCDTPTEAPANRARDVVDCKRTRTTGGTVSDPRPVDAPKSP